MNMFAYAMLSRFMELVEQRGWGLIGTSPRLESERAVSTLVRFAAQGVDLEIQVIASADPPATQETMGLGSMHRGNERNTLQLMLLPEVRPAQGDLLRNSDINFADWHGNMYLSGPGVLVDIRGQHAAMTEETASILGLTRGREKQLDIYSPVRAKVVFALVTWPALFHQPVRHIARAAGTSLGAAQQVVEAIRERHGEVDSSVRAGLYQGWLSSYPDRLLPKLRIAEFQSQDPREVKGDNAFLSGESAVPELIRPATVTVYTNSLESAMINANRWRKSTNPNVYVRHKFWRTPTALEGIPSSSGTAPGTLIYADLLATGDARLGEVAREFARHNLQLRELIFG